MLIGPAETAANLTPHVEFTMMSTSQIASIPLADMTSLSTHLISALSGGQVQALTGTQVAALNTKAGL